MAQFKPYKIARSKLDSLPIKEGQFICFTDSDEMYLDVTNSKRISLLGSNVKSVVANGSSLTITKGDGTSTSVTLADMKAATSNAAGGRGLVPAPAAGAQGKYLRGDGTWQFPPNTTYGVASTSANGLMSSADKTKLDGIATNANKYSLPTASASTLGGIKVGTDHEIASGVLTAKTMTGATTEAAGAAGKVPAPAKGAANRYLRSDGTWQVPPDTKTTLSSLGITATASELNKLDGVTATATEINYIDGVTSNIQTQLNSKVPTSRKINNKPLSADVTLGAGDVGAIPASQKGAINGVAELDENGHVPTSQLPSYVDDVIEGYYKAADGKFYYLSSMTGSTIDGETGKIYIDLNTLKTYRWSGSAFAVISETLALGATSSTAFRGDHGNTAYQHAAAKGAAFNSGLYKITTNAQGHVTAATAVTKADITNLGIPGSDTNTHYVSKNVVGATTATADTTNALSNNNVYLNSVENGKVTSSHKIRGVGRASVYTDTNADIFINSIPYENASTSAAGLMSATDKEKLDGIKSVKYLNLSIATNAWAGSGPYTYTFSDSEIKEDTFCIFNFTDSSKHKIISPISWTTSSGKVILLTNIKPNGLLVGYIALISNVADESAENIRSLKQIANGTYQGTDLTIKFAEEIANYSDPWAWIKARIKVGNFLGLYVCDYIPFTTTNGYTFHAQIAGIDTYYKYGNPSPTPHHIDFVSKELWPENVKMNLVDYNNGINEIRNSFLISNAYAYLNSLSMQVPNGDGLSLPVPMKTVDYSVSGVYHYLPDALKKTIVKKRILVPVRYSANGRLSSDNGWQWVDFDKLWLPSEVEVAGMPVSNRVYLSSGGYTQYPIFTKKENQIKNKVGTNTKYYWWTCSASGDNFSNFVSVNFDGCISTNNSSQIYSVPICFRL